jgi:site-specific DNA-methyltransferase (adenine-specific)
LRLDAAETAALRQRLIAPDGADMLTPDEVIGRTVLGDCRDILPRLPRAVADLLILDPPYNRSMRFGDRNHSKRSPENYRDWLGDVLDAALLALKPNATVYICGDWQSSPEIHAAAAARLKIRNRITWEREKGRGAQSNWKNSSEDIWFCTVGDAYTFNVDAVKVRRRVIAPYRGVEGAPKDWCETESGKHRDTHPSNLWTDVTVPFWSMPENTEHPTQKPEKLIAKLILASSNPGDVVLDPFLGSGTSAVVAKKLDRRHIGIEQDEHYALLAEKRLARADQDRTIQGYRDGVFWERNSQPPRS